MGTSDIESFDDLSDILDELANAHLIIRGDFGTFVTPKGEKWQGVLLFLIGVAEQDDN